MYSILHALPCKWIETGLNGFRCNLMIELGFGLFGLILVVLTGFEAIRVDLHRFCWICFFFS